MDKKTESKVTISAHCMLDGAGGWNLVGEFLKLRHSVFVNKMGWELSNKSVGEFEQYDTPATVYILASRENELLGGLRLLKTTHKNAVYSYMLRDSYLGLLEGLPKDICTDQPPISDEVWELTRLVTKPDANISKELIVAANAYLYGKGAKKCLVLARPALARLMGSLNLNPKALGTVNGNASGPFRAFSGKIKPSPSNQYENF